MKTVFGTLLIACMAVLLSGVHLYAESISFKVVVNEANQEKSISRADASRIFLKKKSQWTSGAKIEPVDLPGESAVREEFSQAVHGKSVSAVKAYWQQQIFSGRGVPPPELADDKEVVAYVRKNPGAIGYVSKSADVSGVKVIDLQD